LEVRPHKAEFTELIRDIRTPNDQIDNVVTCDCTIAMRAVCIRQLKAKLTEALRAVGRGEVILVTDRGRVIAELEAPGVVPSPSVEPTDRKIDLWLREGRAKLEDDGTPATYPVSPVSLPAGTA
jgi:hypothetical protein